jgi:hypothetical protein
MTRAAVLGVLAALALAACSPAEDPKVTESNPAGTNTAAITSGTVASRTGSATDDLEPVGPMFVEGAAMTTLLLRTPTTGVGSRPLLEWDPVAGVDRYLVFIFDPDGTPYWSWSTADPEVFVGWLEPDDPNTPGPRIWTELTWTVLGLDTAGVPIAQSELRPIAP